MSTKIPHTLDNQIMLWHADSKSSAWITEQIRKPPYSIQCSESLVRKRVQDIRRDRADIVGVKVLTKLEGSVTKDLDFLDGIIMRALEDELRARSVAWNENQTLPNGTVISAVDENGDLKQPRTIAGGETWSRLMVVVKNSRADLMTATIKRLELAGADGKNKPPVTEDQRNALMAKLDILINQAIQKVPSSVKGPPDLKVVSSTP